MLPANALLNPALAGMLEKIVSGCSFDVAELRPAERRGTRRQATRRVNDYGRTVDVVSEMIEVSIPFVGSRESFLLSPSSCIEIASSAHISGGALKATFDDDEQLDQNVNILIDRTSKNLDQLRKEMAAFKTELLAMLGTAADERIAGIKAQKERNKIRSFPIE
jgi:hypothetical protein